VTEKDFTKILIDLSHDIGDIKGSVGTLSGKVDYSIRLHETCPARLGFDALKDTTASFKLKNRNSTDAGAPPVSPVTAFLKTVAPYLWKGLILFGLAVGASVVARLSTSDIDQKPTINAIQAISDVVTKTEIGVTQIEKTQAAESDAGQ
jgi:hypothetical protein